MYEEAERFHEETDRDLERRVTAFLADRNIPALRRLGVRSHRGVVTLRGRVRTFYEKQLSGQSARRVAGVVDVIDATEVESDAVLLVARPAAGRKRDTRVSPPVVVTFDSHPGDVTQISNDRSLDPISQAKG